MTTYETTFQEGVLGLKYAGASLVGFAVDAALLHVLTGAGMEVAWARVISLTAAMQVTFLINGLHVFRSLERSRLPRQWVSYMLTNGFGNFCNYWIFVTLVSLHEPLVSEPLVALTIAAFVAWLMNYASTRFLVFGKLKRVVIRNVVAEGPVCAAPTNSAPVTPPNVP